MVLAARLTGGRVTFCQPEHLQFVSQGLCPLRVVDQRGYEAVFVEPLAIDAGMAFVSCHKLSPYSPLLDQLAKERTASARGSLLDSIVGFALANWRGRLDELPLFRGCNLPPYLHDLKLAAGGNVRDNSTAAAEKDELPTFLDEAAKAFSAGQAFPDVLLPTTQAGPDAVKALAPGVLLLAGDKLYAGGVPPEQHAKNLKTTCPKDFYTSAS